MHLFTNRVVRIYFQLRLGVMLISGRREPFGEDAPGNLLQVSQCAIEDRLGSAGYCHFLELAGAAPRG